MALFHGTVLFTFGGFSTFVSTKKLLFRCLLRKYRRSLLLIAEERIQQELDGVTRNEKALCIYFLHFVYF